MKPWYDRLDMENVTPSNVTHEERQQILEAIAKRRKPQVPDFGVRTKQVVSNEEYQRRMIVEMKRDAADAEVQRKARIQTYIKQWRKAVGERFGSATTDNPIILDKIQRIKAGTGGHRTSLVLAGDLGIGKTWSAYAYLNEMIKQGLYNPAEIVHDTEASVLGRIASGGFKRDELFEKLCDPMHKVFFIDDVGQAHYYDEARRQSVWFELINHIYANDLILVMTTNKKFKVNTQGRFSEQNSLMNWMGDAAFDRMRNIVGNDGLIVPGSVNQRPQVFKDRDDKTDTSSSK